MLAQIADRPNWDMIFGRIGWALIESGAVKEWASKRIRADFYLAIVRLDQVEESAREAIEKQSQAISDWVDCYCEWRMELRRSDEYTRLKGLPGADLVVPTRSQEQLRIYAEYCGHHKPPLETLPEFFAQAVFHTPERTSVHMPDGKVWAHNHVVRDHLGPATRERLRAKGRIM